MIYTNTCVKHNYVFINKIIPKVWTPATTNSLTLVLLQKTGFSMNSTHNVTVIGPWWCWYLVEVSHCLFLVGSKLRNGMHRITKYWTKYSTQSIKDSRHLSRVILWFFYIKILQCSVLMLKKHNKTTNKSKWCNFL